MKITKQCGGKLVNNNGRERGKTKWIIKIGTKIKNKLDSSIQKKINNKKT